jgi:hypothetical protein
MQKYVCLLEAIDPQGKKMERVGFERLFFSIALTLR